MKKICAHCGKPFEGQRSSRLYCSDNCKQLAYYKRNGLILSSSKAANVLLMDNITVKDVNGGINVKDIRPLPDSFIEQLNAIIEEEVVKRMEQRSEQTTIRDSAAIKPYFTVDDRHKNILYAGIAKETGQQDRFTVKDITAEKQSFTLNAKSDFAVDAGEAQRINSKTFDNVPVSDNKLFDNDINVKDTAIKKQSFTLSDKPDSITRVGAEQNKNNYTSNKEELEREAENLQDELLSDIDDLIEGEIRLHDIVKLESNNSETKENIKLPSTDQFKWFYSSFTGRINNNVLFSEGENLMSMKNFGTGGVKVLEIFKCILKQLLLFSNRNEISSSSLITLSNTFYMLVNSKEFRLLPKSFPYHAKIKALQEKIRSFAQSTVSDESVRLRLSIEQRAMCFTILYEMGDNVKDVKWSEVAFKSEVKLNKKLGTGLT